MGIITIKVPDIGEGIAQAELVEWHVKEGDLVREDDDLAAVMTDKATVEIPSPVDGKITWLGADIGQMVAVGSELIKIEAEGIASLTKIKETEPKQETSERIKLETVTSQKRVQSSEKQKTLASPAVRKKARDAGIDLAMLAGSGPEGRIVHADLEEWLQDNDTPHTGYQSNKNSREIPVVGLRRKIAERMSLAKDRIPHITLVEEVNVTALEGLRGKLNRSRTDNQPKLTLLPFIIQAMNKAIHTWPNINSTYDDKAGIVYQHNHINTGIATQTPSGLMVPVIQNIEKLDIWNCASEINRLAEAARNGKAKREELSGSTITITSLGALGGIMSTPIINHPEVAIIGINKIQIKPIWDGTKFVPKKIMNLSSGFDHRIIDGWDAAHFIQELKQLLETPHNLLKNIGR